MERGGDDVSAGDELLLLMRLPKLAEDELKGRGAETTSRNWREEEKDESATISRVQ